MQGKWSLSSWLFEVWPSFLLPSSRGLTSRDSTDHPSNHMQHGQLSKLVVDILSYEYVAKPRSKDLGGAWKAALQAAIGIFPWRDVGEAHGRDGAFGKGRKSHQNNRRRLSRHHVDVYRNIEAPLSLAYARTLSLILEHFFIEANSLCFPAVLALSAVMMPPLDNLPSKLLPAQLDKAEDDTLDEDDFKGVGVMGTPQVPAFISNGQYTLDKVVVEPKTGFQFPSILCPNAFTIQNLDNSIQILVGVGLKSLTIVKLKSIKIYAFGLYIRPDMFKAHFSEKYGAIPPEDLKHNPYFYEDLLRHDLGLTVRLMVHYKVLKMGMVRSAFDTSLRKRLKKIKGVEDDEGLEAFNSYFSQNLLLPRGTIIDFRWLPGGQFRTEIDGQPLGTIHSHDFCKAFFDIYVGDPPVSLKAKEEMGDTLGQILRMR